MKSSSKSERREEAIVGVDGLVDGLLRVKP
jgi:hypothetical protein